MNKLAIVVLSWNGADILKSCLNSLEKQSYDNYQIIVVDNDSKDSSRDVLKQQKELLGEKLHVIYNRKNSGFAGGVNIGIKYSLENGFDGVALFNSDATADKDWLANLAKVLDEQSEVGIATGLLLHQGGGTIDSTGEFYSKWGLAFPRFRGKPSSQKPASGLVFGATGGASLYRAEMLRQIGLFDENFFAYFEDVDISFRAQLSGWKVYYTSEAIAYHEQGGSSKKIPGFTIQQIFKNLPLLYIKNVPTKYLLPVGIRLWVAYIFIMLNTIRHGSFFYAIKGWLMSIVYTPASILKRFSIQSGKKVSNNYINSVLWDDLPPEQSGMRRLRALLGGAK